MSRIAKAAAVVVGTGAVALSGAGMAMADAGAQGAASNSPGVLSGNVVQVPIHVPVNVCGNTINVVGLLNPAFGNTCVNGDGDVKQNKAAKKHHTTKKHHTAKKHLTTKEHRGYGN